MPKGGTASLVELRVLDGPNLYFTRPAVKLTLAVPGWLAATEAKVAGRANALGLRAAAPNPRGNGSGSPRARPGPPGSEQRLRDAEARIGVNRALRQLGSRIELTVVEI